MSQAKQMDMFFDGWCDSSGQPLKGSLGYKIYFWESSGASTPKTVWNSIDKSDANIIDQTSGILLGERGELNVYGDGVYFYQIKGPDGSVVPGKTGSGTISYSSDVDFGGIYIDVATTHGTSDAALQDMIVNQLNPSEKYVLLFKNAVFNASNNITYGDNIIVKGHISATYNQTNGAVITINNQPDIDCFQFFTGTPNVNWGANVHTVLGKWTGGTYLAYTVNPKRKIGANEYDVLPIGSLIQFPSATIPSGWLECNGSSKLRATYPELFAVIGVTYGSASSTHFTLPDCRGRVLVGHDGGAGVDLAASSRTDRGDGTTGDNVGTLQGSMTKVSGISVDSAGSHDHNFRWIYVHHPDSGTDSFSTHGGSSYNTSSSSGAVRPAGEHTHTLSGGDVQTAMSNIAIKILIKAF